MKEFNPVEFWQWCGFTVKERRQYNKADYCSSIDGYDWTNPDGETFYLTWESPEVDLNNLFKWAMPKLDSYQIGIKVSRITRTHLVSILHYTVDHRYFRTIASDPDLATALRNAIWELICKEKEPINAN